MSRQEGYTAAEALAALAILGLATTGLTTSMMVIGASQAKARAKLEQAAFERAADQRLERFLARGEPFRSDQADRLIGRAQALDFVCGGGQRCAIRIGGGRLIFQDHDGHETWLRLPDGEAPRFVYLGAYSVSEAWPPAPSPPPAPPWQNLAAVMVQSDAEAVAKPLAIAKLWRQQKTDCEYDVVVQDCRGTP